MNVIKRGEPPEKWSFRHECKKCRSILEVFTSDLGWFKPSGYGEGWTDANYVVFKCCECGYVTHETDKPGLKIPHDVRNLVLSKGPELSFKGDGPDAIKGQWIGGWKK